MMVLWKIQTDNLRRYPSVQVPTIAIEHVWIAVNSSIIQDEVLAHRVGLIPIRADARRLDYVIGDEETDKDTIVFHFDVECTAGSGDRVINGSALSGAMKWLPQGSQNEVFPEGVAPVHDDIVVAKLKPGQRIEFEAHCRKGVGKCTYNPFADNLEELLADSNYLLPSHHRKGPHEVQSCGHGLIPPAA